MGNKKKKSAHRPALRKSSDANKELEQRVNDAFRRRTDRLKRSLANRKDTLEDHDLCEPWLSRRIRAVCAQLPAYVERYSTRYPNTNIAEEFTMLCASSKAIPDDMEQQAFFSLGAALWILDRLKDEQKMAEALELLPQNVLYEDIEVPYYYDISHSEEVVESMLFLIQHKNDEINQSYKVKSKYFRPRYIFDYAAAIDNTDAALHRQYRQVLDLIPQQTIDTAITHFREKCIEWLDLYFEAVSERAGRIKLCNEKIEAFQHKLDSLEKELETKARAAKKLGATPAKIGPVNLNLLQSPAMIPERSFTQPDPIKSEMLRIIHACEETEHELDELLEYQTKLLFWADDAKTMTLKMMSAMLGEQTAKRLFDFNVDDPYEICFAFFYLIELGDDIPWLHSPAIAVLNAAACKLPWGIFEYDEFEDYVQHPEVDDVDIRKRTPITETQRITDDWLGIKYHTDYEPDYDSDYLLTSFRNLAQIVYEKTGAVMPRDLRKYEVISKSLRKSGLTPKQITSLLPLMSVLGEIQRQTKPKLYFDDEPIDELQPEAEDTASDLEKSEAEIKRLRGEVKKLQQSLHDSLSETRKAQEALEKAEAEGRTERQELADLRELLFNQQDGSYLSEKAEEDISFPYETVRRTVVFGGHDTWVKEIKPRLPNVRFIDRGAIPNAEMIRHADIIWIQTNAIPHMYYNIIIDQVRKHNVPLRYFAYASAEKCAAQVVREDG